MPEALEGGENSACTPSCPLEAEDAELTAEGLALLDQAPEDQESSAERLRRRQLDGLIVERLRTEGFAGKNYEKIVDRLTGYGYHTMIKWAGSGEIFRKARQVGRPVPADKITLMWTAEDRHGVSVDSVLGGLKVFRTYGLIEGRWTPQGERTWTPTSSAPSSVHSPASIFAGSTATSGGRLSSTTRRAKGSATPSPFPTSVPPTPSTPR